MPNRKAHILCARLAVWLLVVMTLGGSAFAGEVRPEVQRLETFLENKLAASYQSLFGDAIKTAITITVNRKVKPTDSVDLGYLPVPLGTSESLERAIEVESLFVSIDVLGEHPPETIAALAKIAQNSLKSLNPKLDIRTVTELPKKADLEKEKERSVANDALPTPTPVATPTATPVPQAEKESNFKLLLPLVLVIVAGLFVLLSVYLIARSLSGAAKSLSEGLVEQASTRAPAEPMPQPQAPPAAVAAPVAVTESPRAVTAEPKLSKASEYLKNLKVTRQVLQLEPKMFVETLGANELDWEGLRRLLPRLTFEEQEKLKTFLGPQRAARLSSSQSKLKMGDSADALPNWLGEFVQRLMLKKIRGSSPLEIVLGPERSLALFCANAKDFLALVRTSSDPLAWRVAVDFLPRETLQSVMSELSEAEWKVFLAASDVPLKDVVPCADRLLDQLKVKSNSNSMKQDRAEYYSQTMVEPLVQVVLSKHLDEQDAFLANFRNSAPELVRLVHDLVWTPSQLDLIADHALAAAIKELSVDQMTALVFALPASQSERIKTLLPKGNSAAIVTDRGSKLRLKSTLAQRETAGVICRQFLDLLRQRATTGTLELKSASGSREGTGDVTREKAA